jgi:TRAP-type C4-dicarboxylate transport system permease small subunit
MAPRLLVSTPRPVLERGGTAAAPRSRAMATVSENVVPLEGALEIPAPRVGSLLMRPVEAVAAVLLVVIVSLLLVGVTTRYAFSKPIVWIDEVASFSFLWFAMLGSAIAIDRNEHLRLTLFLGMIPERLRGFVNTLALLLVATFLIALAQPSVDYAMEEWFVHTPALDIPNTFRVSAIPFGIFLMLGIVVVHVVRTSSLRDVVVAALLIGAATAALWFLSPTFLRLGQANILIFLVGLVALCLIAGVPIAFCFGLGTVAFLAFSTRVRSSWSWAAWTRGCRASSCSRCRSSCCSAASSTRPAWARRSWTSWPRSWAMCAPACPTCSSARSSWCRASRAPRSPTWRPWRPPSSPR